MNLSPSTVLGGTADEVNQASIEMGTYGFQLACERKDQGGDDLISLIINQEVEGHQLSEMEFASLFIQLTVAGNETTRGLISSGMYELRAKVNSTFLARCRRAWSCATQAAPSAMAEALRLDT